MGFFGDKHAKDLRTFIDHANFKLKDGARHELGEVANVITHTLAEGAGKIPPNLEAEAQQVLARLEAKSEADKPKPVGERLGLCEKCGGGDYFVWPQVSIKLGSRTGSGAYSPYLILSVCKGCGKAEWYATDTANADNQGIQPETVHVDPPTPS